MVAANPTVLSDFHKSSFSALGRTRDVYRMGTGPNVVVLSEMPGITPELVRFARGLVDRGFSVTIPHLFGKDGAQATNAAFRRTLLEVCVSREFTLLATNDASRVTKWLNELASHEHAAHGGAGVGVVGMCLTGGFALAMMMNPSVVAPVLSQPSLPAGKSPARRSALGVNDEQRAALVERAQAGQCVMGLRFTNDPLAAGERFAALRALLGDNFIGIEIDSSPGNEWNYPADAHSVLTGGQDFVPDSPTSRAMESVMSFFERNLNASA